MDNNRYLIPANANRGKLIFGLFRPVDLVILCIGVGISLLLITLNQSTIDAKKLILTIIPGFVSVVLVWPLPMQYQNVLIFLRNMLNYYTSRQNFYWRGWYSHGKRKNK